MLARRLAGPPDGRGKIVGRLASVIVKLLTGKHKPNYNPSLDMGDCVVVTNCRDVVFTGKKWSQKVYRWHTGAPGGLKERTLRDMWIRHPERILRRAVNGMLPKNKLRDDRLHRLKIYTTPTHPHVPQVNASTAHPHILKMIQDETQWRSQIFDPNLHKAWVVRFEDTPESINVVVNETPGKKPFKVKSSLRPLKWKQTDPALKLRPEEIPLNDEELKMWLKSESDDGSLWLAPRPKIVSHALEGDPFKTPVPKSVQEAKAAAKLEKQTKAIQDKKAAAAAAAAKKGAAPAKDAGKPAAEVQKKREHWVKKKISYEGKWEDKTNIPPTNYPDISKEKS